MNRTSLLLPGAEREGKCRRLDPPPPSEAEGTQTTPSRGDVSALEAAKLSFIASEA